MKYSDTEKGRGEASGELEGPFLLAGLPSSTRARRPLLPWVREPAPVTVRVGDLPGPFDREALERLESASEDGLPPDDAEPLDASYESAAFEYDLPAGSTAPGPFPDHAYSVTLDTSSTLLQTLLDQKLKDDVRFRSLCVSVVDLTDSPATPPYAGRNDDQVLYVGSLAKVGAMYAAYELRARVQKVVDAMAPSQTVANWQAPVLARIKTDWKKPLDDAREGHAAGFPDLDLIFDFPASGPVDFKRKHPAADLDQVGFDGSPSGLQFGDWLTLMIRWSSDTAAALCITALSYPFINGALAAAGLHDPAHGAVLRVAGSYEAGTKAFQKHGKPLFPDWAPSNLAGVKVSPEWQKQDRTNGRSNFAATSRTLARTFTMLSRLSLVDSAASAEMLDLLQKDGHHGIFSYAYGALAGHRTPTHLWSKIGIGDDVRYHDCVLVERTEGTKKIAYVAAGLGAGRDHSGAAQRVQDLEALFVAVDDVVLAAH